MGIDEIDANRLLEVEKIRQEGENPYPYSYNITSESLDIHKKAEKLEPGSSLDEIVGIGGRVMTTRSMGKISFFTVQDAKGKIQLCIRKNKIGEENYGKIKRISVGDIIGARGDIIRTRSGEVSIDVEEYSLLAKAIRNFPDKFHGIKDTELKYRQRELDLIMNPEVREIFLKRSQAIREMRNYLNNKGFVEVEVPTLQSIYGGASAKPFVTHLNALNIPLYLSISPELYLKRLIVGGIEKNFTICKNFRNEGIDKTHNPEFTMMECYWAYADYKDVMKLTEDMYEHIFREVNGRTTINYGGQSIDFKAPWERRTMYGAIKAATGINVKDMAKEDIAKEIAQRNLSKIPYIDESETRGDLVQELFEQYAEQTLVGPVFIIDHPKESTPLCKTHRVYPELIERFEPFVMGMEIGNAYSELNDPILQRRLFEEQAEKLRQGNEEAHPMDHEFVRALEYGMPPTGGLGLGIDRMVMLLTEQTSIRDVILFPFMRPEQ